MRLIDLRSDTLTLPTKEMLQASLIAKMGDDGREREGKGEDETVIELEKTAARILNKDDAIFVHSGTFGNMVSLMSHTTRGGRVIVGHNSHIYKSEKGSFDQNILGLEPVVLQTVLGRYNLSELEAELRRGNVAVVCFENTVNFEGGVAITVEEMEIYTDLCKKYNVKTHLDGARLFNSARHLKVNPSSLVKDIDSVMVCLSKGLCAPIGSVVCGSKDFIYTVRKNRKLLGGQLRQAGIIAAPGIIALNKMIDRLDEDHYRAKIIAEGINSITGLSIDLNTVQTNILRVDITSDSITSDYLISLLDTKFSLKVHKISEKEIRICTYHGITDEDAKEAISRLRSCMSEINKEV